MKKTIIFLLITAFIITAIGCGDPPKVDNDEPQEKYEQSGSITFSNTSDFYKLVENGSFGIVEPEALIKIEDIVDQEIIDHFGVRVYVYGKNDYSYSFLESTTMVFSIEYNPSASINDQLDNPEKYTEMDGSPASKGKGGYEHKHVYHLDGVDLYYSAIYFGAHYGGTYLVMYTDGFIIQLDLLNRYIYDIYSYDTPEKEVPEKYIDWLKAYFDEDCATEEINHVKDVVLNREHRPVEPDTSPGAGCGGFSVFAGFIALVCAAGTIVLVKKK